MTQTTKSKQGHLEQNYAKEHNAHTASVSITCDAKLEDQDEHPMQSMVTPTGTTYLTSDGEYSPGETKLPNRVQSSQSLLGLVGLEGHEESEEDVSTSGISAVTEEQEVIDIMLSPSTPKSPPSCQGTEDASCNTTPPGSIQGPGILSFSPPLLTTYSTGSVTSASVTENFVLQPRPIQSIQRQNHTHQESPRFSRSPQVQQPQLKPRSRPPRAPQYPTMTPGGSNSVGGGPIVMPRAVVGTGPELSSISGTGVSCGGHTRTPTDATNYSFLSSLTEMSGGGEYSAPRRRTLSWDNNGYSGRGAPAMESKSLGGAPASFSILQPILLPEDINSVARPPTSISAANLRKASPTASGSNTTTTTPAPGSSSRNTTSTLLLAPSSLPSRESLHPLIKKLQNVSYTKSTLFISPTSSSKDRNNLPASIQRTHDTPHSKSSQTASTSVTSPFTVYLQDEKKDDDPSPSQQIVQQKTFQDRRSSDYTSLSSSFCSSTTVRLQKTTNTSPGHTYRTFERQTTLKPQIRENCDSDDFKIIGKARFDLKDILNLKKDCHLEADIVESIERNDLSIRNKNQKNDVSLLHDWPCSLLAWGILNLVLRGFRLIAVSEVKNLMMCNESIQFSLGLGVVELIRRHLSKEFFDWQVVGHYRGELLFLRKIWVVLNELSALSTKEEKDDIKESPFPNLSQHIDDIMDLNGSSSFKGLGTTREHFIETVQDVYERLSKSKDRGELSFKSLCEVAKLSDDSDDLSKIKILSDLFCPPRSGQVSKFDFVKSTDSIFKATIILIANINNASQICTTVDKIMNGIFYTIVLGFVPSIFGAGISTLMVILVIMTLNIALLIYYASAEHLKGIIYLLTEKPYDIGDRIHFVEVDGKIAQIDNGPPSGGWVVEGFDLYKTTLRQGIAGERITLANGSVFLTNSRVVNWKRWHGARVTVSVEFSGNIGSNKIRFVQKQITEWIKDRPREWIGLDSFRMADVYSHQHAKLRRVKFNVILRHRDSWHNYGAVQDSKSDILFFLHELQKGLEA